METALEDYLGGFGAPKAGWNRGLMPATLCLRTRFAVADPAKATDLKVNVVGLGGFIVYVNGREIGRAFMPRGDVLPLTLAEPYGIEAYTHPGGVAALPDVTGRAKHGDVVEAPPDLLPRYRQRIRRASLAIPPGVLVKGSNVLAVGIHQAPVSGPIARLGWSHVGFHSITVTSASGAGAVAYAEALKGPYVWTAGPLDQIANEVSVKSLYKRVDGRPVQWMRGKAFRGIGPGNPADPVLPIRMAAPRNGTCSGQTVVTDVSGVRELTARLGPLKGAKGTIPAAAIEIRYAAQLPGVHYCDAFVPAPPNDANTVPVWVLLTIPKDQAPGWYAGTLDIRASGKAFAVPVQVLVTGLTLCDARDLSPNVQLTNSPDHIAAHYKVKPWSDQHFRLMAPSMRMQGQVGNDVVQVPVILGGMSPAARDWFTRGSKTARWEPLVRWVKTDKGLAPEFSLLEKYLDAYLKHAAPPKALCLYVWDSGCSKEVSDAYENRRIPTRDVVAKTPLLVLQWDPKTGETTDANAPNFGDPGAEAFWKPLFDGVRQIVVKRGWSERIILAGLGGDLRPGKESGELLRQWAPYVRWQILSHFSGDPGPKDGKLIATGGLEVGSKGYPWRSFITPLTAAELEKEIVSPFEYLDLPTVRWHWMDDSPPYMFRTMAMIWGSVGHLGLDFWGRRDMPRNSSFFTSSESMSAPGENGAEPTVRFQMLREGVQDAHIRWELARAALKMAPDRRKAVHDLLDEFARRVAWGIPYLSQMELSYDWPSYAAAVQEVAAELAGVQTDARWTQPPK